MRLVRILDPCVCLLAYLFLGLFISFLPLKINSIPMKEKISAARVSLVAQWLRIHLPMQRTRVRALVREDPTCHRATKPMCHNY